MNKEELLTTQIKPQNKEMEVLKKHFAHCFDKNGDFQIEKFKETISEHEVNFSKESYTMDWLGKSYARLLAIDAATTLLKEDTAHNHKKENENAENLLLKGDNLEVLKHLTSAYYEKVKMIYIDPPYNTGNDGFVYQDNRKFSVEDLQELAGIDEERAQRILDFTQSKSNSHSAWLTFMYPRLYIAKQLLREDGVIFISIDDNEVAQLKLMMDEVFGEENFVASVIWEKKFSPQNDAKWLSENHDFILCYGKYKNSLSLELFPRTEKMNEAYKNIDNDKRGKWTSGDLLRKDVQPSGLYPITSSNGTVHNPPSGRSWRVSESKFKEMVEDNRIWFGRDGGNVPRIKRFLSEVQNGIKGQTIWKHTEAGHNQEASQELRKMFNGKALFETPKPVRLISRILYLSTKENDIILDFFAGSGTTGEAVMQLNAEDGGNRKYILVQL